MRNNIKEDRLIISKLDNIEERLENLSDTLEGQLAKLIDTIDTIDTGSGAGDTPIERTLIEIDGMQAPWVLGGLEWDGKSEVYDEEELHEFLGFNPNDNDADGKSWCAGFWISVFNKLRLDTTGLNLNAISFKDFGYDIMPPAVVDIPNGAILVFQPSDTSKTRISHVGVKIDDDKLFGGNQGDSAKRSNLAWYMDNANLVASRCPNGFKLV